MSDEEYEEAEELTGSPNWADWATAALCVPFYAVKGLMRGLEIVNALLELKSKNIDDRRDMQNSVHLAIESLNEMTEED